LAVAPDGSFVVYRSLHSDESGRQSSVLRLRAWNELEPRAMTDAINARSPFISPDGLWIGYFGPGEIQKIPVAGGPPETICRFAGAPGGASWGDDGTIVFSSSEMDGLQRVPATGGEPVRLTTSEMPKRVRHTMPHYLPGSRFVLFTKFDAAQLTWMTQVVEVATGTVKVVLPDAYLPAYSATGHLVYVATLPQSAAGGEIRNSVRAVRFDGARAEVVGEPVTMIDQIPPETAVLGSLGVSRRGDLVYLPDIGGATSRPLRQLVWVDRKGVETAILAPARSYGTARISPDGSRVAVDVRDETNDIWVWDLTRQTFTRVNREESLDSVPIWMPDGNRLVWASTRAGGNPNWYRMAADGTGTAERLTTATRTHFPTSITADGRTVLGFAAGVGSMDLISVTISGPESELKPLIATPASEYGAELSPDGQWIAYHSGESGEDQVYVRPYPNVDGGRWQVSNAGGTRPAWSRDGRELFYLNRDGFLTSVAVLPAAGGQFSAGLPAQILKTAYARGRTTLGLDVRAYDVSPDGRRFLMLTEPPAPPVSTLSPRIVVALNWGEELKARLPAAP
jgi:serine/threonine-protein kinase